MKAKVQDFVVYLTIAILTICIVGAFLMITLAPESNDVTIGDELNIPDGYEVVGYGWHNSEGICRNIETGAYHKCFIGD